MWLDGVGFAPPLEDPDKSRVVGKVGYGIMPKGPKAQASATFGDGIGVTAESQQQGGRLSLLPVGGLEADGRAPAAGGRRRAVPQLDPQRRRGPRKGVKMPAAWIDAVVGIGARSAASACR